MQMQSDADAECRVERRDRHTHTHTRYRASHAQKRQRAICCRDWLRGGYKARVLRKSIIYSAQRATRNGGMLFHVFFFQNPNPTDLTKIGSLIAVVVGASAEKNDGNHNIDDKKTNHSSIQADFLFE